MNLNKTFTKWADAHVFYDLYLHPQKKNLTLIEEAEYKWRRRNYQESSQGKLLLDNAFFRALKGEKIYLFHITTNLDKILKKGAFYSSSGCLIGSIYCTPLASDQKKGRLRIHNH